jgi:hypothetical protein
MVTTSELAEAEVENTLYYLFCWQAGHTKKDFSLKLNQTQNVGNPKCKPIVSAKDSAKGVTNHLCKQLKCSHYGWNHHVVENCFALHPEKRHSFEKK